MRLLEAMASGAVPVVTNDVVLPWENQGFDWEACAVRVSSAEVYSLPSVLRGQAPPDSIAFAKRRVACARIWHFLTNDTGTLETLNSRTHMILWQEISKRIAG